MDIDYRILTAADSKLYRELRLESLRTDPTCFQSDYTSQTKLAKLYFEKLIEAEDPRHPMLGAFSEEELVGICGLIPAEVESAEVIQMYLKTSFRKMGIRQRLLNFGKHIAQKQLGANALILTVFANNLAGFTAYQRAGFQVVRQDGNDILMQLHLVEGS